MLDNTGVPQDFRTWVTTAFMYAQGRIDCIADFEDDIVPYLVSPESVGIQVSYNEQTPFEVVLGRFCALIFYPPNNCDDLDVLEFEHRLYWWRLAYRMYKRWFKLHPPQTAHSEHNQENTDES